MGGRDHSIKCDVCGMQRGGLNDYKCDCDEKKKLHISEQLWLPEQREDGVFVIGIDGTVILKMGRADHGSDLLMAGYIVGLQALALKRNQ